MLLMCLMTLLSCNNYETYADKKEQEQDAISDFIAKEGIRVISEEEFAAQGENTDTTLNEYVRLSRSGVYM